MEFVVTARKWRPQRFDEVIGQEHITQTLKNAVRFNRIHQAYLFSGPRGVGKTTTARILARAVNCESLIDFEPCNKCESCISILDGRSLDVIEIDGASNNSVDDVRNLRENAKYPPILGKYKIYIIDEVHMLSTSAFNALLKILEEPPKHLIFIFATTEPHKVIPTILSRCQRFDFHRMEINTIIEQISKIAKAEKIEIDDMSLFTIAKKADGSMRDAQSIFDQFVASAGKVINFENVKELLNIIDTDYYFRVSDAYHTRNTRLAFEISEEITRNGYDYNEFISGLLEHYRNIFFVKITNNPEKLSIPKAIQQKYFEEASKYNEKDLIRILNLIATTEQQIKYSSMPRIRLELLLTQLIQMPTVLEVSELIKEIKELKLYPTSASALSGPTEKKTLSNESTEFAITNSEGDKWIEFLEKYNSKLNGLKSFYLSQLIGVEFKQKQIVILAKNELVYENLNNKKRALRLAIKEFFGNEFDCEIILSEKYFKEEVPIKIEQETNLQSPEKETSFSTQNSIEKLVKDLFNAREIPLP
ncbi:MAG: DNA polymerase III subunit gamma/tau [Ignavibacteria bacterium]|nr:DNA polymerase III subunit gamma/tau [Ignavibacteria bacterium]